MPEGVELDVSDHLGPLGLAQVEIAVVHLGAAPKAE